MSKHQTRCVSRELAVRMEERLLHFMKWMQKQKQVVPYALQENDFLNNAEMEKLIVEYVEG